MIPNDTNSSARYFVRWDLTNLYVAIAITDDTRNSPNVTDSQISNNDAVEIFVDGATRALVELRRQRLAARVRHQHEEGGGAGQPVVTFPTGMQEAWGGTSPSWTLEAAIPWSILGASAAAPGRLVGFDLKLDDNDTGTVRDRDLILYYDRRQRQRRLQCALLPRRLVRHRAAAGPLAYPRDMDAVRDSPSSRRCARMPGGRWARRLLGRARLDARSSTRCARRARDAARRCRRPRAARRGRRRSCRGRRCGRARARLSAASLRVVRRGQVDGGGAPRALRRARGRSARARRGRRHRRRAHARPIRRRRCSIA